MFEALLGTFNIERSNENVRKIREIICDSIEYNLASNLTFQADLAGMNLTLEQYLDNMRKDRTWGANTELTAFIKRFTVELCVINYEEETNRILNINELGNGNFKLFLLFIKKNRVVNLEACDGNHYKGLIPKDIETIGSFEHFNKAKEDLLNEISNRSDLSNKRVIYLRYGT